MSTMRDLQLLSNFQGADIAHASGQLLSRYAQSKMPLKLCFIDSEQAEPIELPASVVTLLIDILTAMAEGQGITVIPENAELTTFQAADVLNVSRSFLNKLLDEKKIPYRKVGQNRRIQMKDLMSYETAIDAEREAVLDQLVAEAQEQDMGYGKP